MLEQKGVGFDESGRAQGGRLSLAELSHLLDEAP
jgi:hypothetical protein